MLSYFKRIYVLNLPERPDRRRHIVSQLESVGLGIQPGRVEIFPAIRPPDASGFPSVGVHGCFLSHMAVLRRALDEDLETVVVMEDDLTFHPGFSQHVGGVVGALRQTPWQIAYLGHREHLDGSKSLQMAPPDLGIMGAHFYALHASGLRTFVSFLESVLTRPAGSPEGGPMHFDGALSFFRARHPEITAVLAVPSLGFQGSSRSDISPRWYDQCRATRPLTVAARRVRGVLARVGVRIGRSV